MIDLALLWRNKTRSGSLDLFARRELEERALYLSHFFTVKSSTPSATVSTVLDSSFFVASNKISVMSSHGPLTTPVRLPNPELTFYESPTLQQTISTTSFATLLRNRNIVRDISLDDLITDLGTHTLNTASLIAVFKFWINLASNRSYDPSLLNRLKNSAMLSLPSIIASDAGNSREENDDVRIASLAMFKTFLNPKVIPVDAGSLPAHTLPLTVTARFSAGDLVKVFQLEELSLVQWVEHVVEMTREAPAASNVLLSAQYAEKVSVVVTL